MVVRETCPACGANRYKKNGHTRHGKQNHQCQACGRQFTANPFDRSIPPEQRRQIEQLLGGLCRKVGFWRPNPKIGYQKINDLRVSTFLFSVICDRAVS